MAPTRRQFLHLGAGAALAAGLGGARAQGGALVSKAIPSSGERIPVVGIGTTRYGRSDRAALRATLETFVAAGGRVIDTAPLYGDSEPVLGGLIADLGLRARLFLATKVYTTGREAGVDSMNQSLIRLKTDALELMQVHNLSDTATQLATMREWKAAGKLRYVGITTSRDGQYEDMERTLKSEKIDFTQVDYSIDNRGAAERILPLAAERGVAVLINLPFGRARLFERVRGKSLPEWAEEIGCASWAQFFLKYVLGHPAVTCAIPGTTKPHHAADNLGAAHGPLPDAAMRRKMEQHFESL